MTMTTLLRRRPKSEAVEAPSPTLDGVTPIADVAWRTRAKVAGRVRSLRVQPWAGVATLEATIVDDTGGITIVFLGRREVLGVHCGAQMVVEGMAGAHHGRLAILNPDYELLAD